MTQWLENQQKFNLDFESQDQSSKQTNVRSESSQNYANIIDPLDIDHGASVNKFKQKGIQYIQGSNYQKFSFQVERIVPCFDFYRLFVKISNFKLKANVAKYYIPKLGRKESDAKGCYSDIYFADVGEYSLCFKSYPLKASDGFRVAFISAVKEWSILKICSALECAPNIDNYLGFDIIIYDDCIQFALQKGSPITKLENSQITQLKQELRMMHAFRIIHGDIKPENIIFSHHYNKPVFIDFGFSEIVSEPLGQKTLSSFKGTPNFCTSEMLSIILDRSALIDLYYNDAFSLKETCKYFLYKQITQPCSNAIEQRKKGNIWYADQKAQTSFMLFNFHYHYINGDELKIEQLIRQLLSKNSQNLQQVLSFVKKGAKHIFYPSFFYNKIQKFKCSAQYEEIQQQLKLGKEALFMQRYFQDQSGERNNFDLCAVMVEPSQLLNDWETKNCLYYLKIILSTDKIQSQFINHLIAIIFQSVRFDQRNLNFESKVQIATHINPLLLQFCKQQLTNITINEEIEQGNLSIKQIKLLMRLIFYFYINQKASAWTKKYLFDVFQQLIILNDNLKEFSQILINYINQHKLSEHILVILQVKRLLQSAMLIKMEEYAKIQDLFLPFIKYRINKYLDQHKNSNNLEQISICKALSTFQQRKQFEDQIQFHSNQEKLAGIQSPHIRKYIQKHYIYERIIVLSAFALPASVIKIIQYVRKSIYIEKLDFLSKVRIFIDLMLLSCNYVALQAYQKYIASVINCPEIFEKLVLDKPNKKYRFNNNFNDKINILIKQLPLIKNPYSQLLSLIWNHSISHKQINANRQLHISKLIQLYGAYEKQKHRLKPKFNHQIQTFISLYSQVRIQFYFYQLSKQTQQAFLQSLQQYSRQQQIFMRNKEKDQQFYQLKYYFMQIRSLLYKFHNSINNKDDQMLLSSLEQIIEYCKILKINYVVFELIKTTNHICCEWKNYELIIYSAQLMFQFCQANNDFSFYLIPINQKYFLNTLHSFARQDQSKFKRLLLSLTQFLSKNPIYATKSYFLSLINSINYFLRYDREFSYLIHYQKFIDPNSIKQIQNNPNILIFCAYSLFNEDLTQQLKLLKIFAVNCGRLSNFARKKLLQKYYAIVLCLLSQKNKRRYKYIWREAKSFVETKKNITQRKSYSKMKDKTIFGINIKRKLRSFLNAID